MWDKINNTIKLKLDMKDSDGIYLLASKEYVIKREERGLTPNTVHIVVDSEIEDIEIVIDVDKDTGDLISDDTDFTEDEQKCRVCGCTWFTPCEGGCYWFEDDLCSKCATDNINI